MKTGEALGEVDGLASPISSIYCPLHSVALSFVLNHIGFSGHIMVPPAQVHYQTISNQTISNPNRWFSGRYSPNLISQIDSL